ncbi:MAG: aspartate aminotransferase family protein [Bacteroidales bacterium]|nr:aspartate aminotransferase family protein [Bacteroidales bacterium]
MDKKKTNYQELDQRYYLPTFNRFPVTLIKGKGSRVWDDNGKEYIDAMAGIAVNSAGHCHPHIVKAIQSQAEDLIHISNFYLSKPQALLSEKLAAISGLDRVFFANSGAEANEGAVKLARKYAHTHNRGGTVISFSGCFHGRTLATIAMGKEKMQEGFEPIPEGFRMIPFNDIEAVKEAVNSDVAAIIIEPVQGEGGIHIADKTFMKQLREICDQENIVLIFDEIQCGMARTGKFFAKEHFGVQPDILTSAKSLGSGVPISAIITNEKVSGVIGFGDHGTTFGGNPLATAAALAAIEVTEDEELAKQAAEKGEWMKNQILNNQPKKYGIREVRGLGLMIGIEFEFETKPIVTRMLDKGVLANATADNVLRFVPPLNITYNELNTVLDVMYQSLKESM